MPAGFPTLADLDRLFSALRAVGFRVGVEESLRLQAVLGRIGAAPTTSAIDLREVVAAVVQKSSESRAELDRVFALWLATLAPVPDDALGLGPRLPESSLLGHYGPRRAWLRPLFWILGTALLALVVLLTARLLPRPWTTQPAPDLAIPAAPDLSTSDLGAQPESGSAAPEKLAESFVGAGLDFYLQGPGYPRGLWIWGGVAGAAMLLGGALFFGLRRRSYLPAPLPLPTRPGLPRVLPTADRPRGAHPFLLSRRDEEVAVWGLGQFVSQERTRRLDISRTVVATAEAGGQPVLRFHLARHSREVWIWMDEALGHSGDGTGEQARRFADELCLAFAHAGLPIERASFWGLPEQLTSEHGVFQPSEVDERREAAVVLLLTDGRQVRYALESAVERPRAAALLRQLARWPSLAFVDATNGAAGLAALLLPFELTVLGPEQVPAFLAGIAPSEELSPRRSVGRLVGSERAWAAALALSPTPVDEETALLLREALDLPVSPWLLDYLRERAVVHAGRIEFGPIERARLLAWLAPAEDSSRREEEPERPPSISPLLTRALAFWRRTLDAEDKRRRSRGPGEPWQDTPAEQHLRMQRALLALWDQPEDAARQLYRLHRDALRPEVRRHLASLGPRECAAEVERGLTVLQWSMKDRSPLARVLLCEMGLGSASVGWKPAAEPLRRPGRLNIAWGLCTGLLLVSVAGVLTSYKKPRGAPTVQLLNAPPDIWWYVKPNGPRYVVDAGNARWAARAADVVPGSSVLVVFKEKQWPCRETLSDGIESWRCGQNPQPPRPAVDWVLHRRVLLGGSSFSDPQARRLATQLLDSGSADHVIFNSSLPGNTITIRDWIRVQGETPIVMREVSAAVRDWRTLSEALGMFHGRRQLLAAWSELTDVKGEAGPVDLVGLGGSCPYKEWTDPKSQMVFVRVCAGEFEMGSKSDNTESFSHEKPAHKVRLHEFWIGKYEVSNELYKEHDPKHHSHADEPNEPVTEVSWDQARRYCAAIGHRLPTEAEWEHAARGSDGRRYPWGDQAPTAERAVFGMDSLKDKPEAVNLHPDGAGPFGTLNQAGNVWEWVEDCYENDSYRQQVDKSRGGAVSNPLFEKPGCDQRVVRGGSFINVPRYLRAAYRGRGLPEDQNGDLGFRCVRGAARQP